MADRSWAEKRSRSVRFWPKNRTVHLGDAWLRDGGRNVGGEMASSEYGAAIGRSLNGARRRDGVQGNTFRAFGSTCRVVVEEERLVEVARRRLEDLEARWSRFRPTSEVSRLNGANGRPVTVSEETRRLVWLSTQAHRMTDGLFDPLLLKELRSCGYDRTFDELESTTDELDARGEPALRPIEEREVRISGSEVALPKRAAFDPGGVGNGLAIDLVLEELLVEGAEWACVSVGGDTIVGGDALRDQGIDVAVEDPWETGDQFGVVSVSEGAVSTSSMRTRRWLQRGAVQHHLLDPRTGLPSTASRVAATVHAPSGWLADVLATAVVLHPEWGRERLAELSASGIAFDAAGHIDLGLPVTPTNDPLTESEPLAA